MTLRSTTFVVLFALALAGAATAEDDGEAYDRSSFYLGAAGSAGIATQLEEDGGRDARVRYGPASAAELDPSLGAHLRAGYRFHPNLSAEIHYEWLDTFRMTLKPPQASNIPSGTENVHLWTLTADGKAFLLRGSWQPFVIAGFGALHVESNALDADRFIFAARLGGGLDLYTTPDFAFTLEATYVLPAQNVRGANLNYVSVGLGAQYRF